MSNGNGASSPAATMRTPILGQPVTASRVAFAVNADIACQCQVSSGGEPVPLKIVASSVETCPACLHRYTFDLQLPDGTPINIQRLPPVPVAP